ncbi:efflux RND transporter periplasmic adaptor subunit [Labrys wisconsinensis]|uniref:RND family efflux transporter MFP subunit n=1 Tax=Labrys wisconsinensis TaxID=425677 RepID=A0ABU0JM96_9HYPH|nr:efflux RND transporter periplasmic adaptor subunit [Labrys wisconsinensis]MDQ0475403.1 RND family efflux transporter MFP subunit [Labrys wisconsinensis]
MRLFHPSGLARAGALLIAAAVAGCGDEAKPPERERLAVLTEVAATTAFAPSVSLTGEVQARYQSDLAFRTGGRIVTRAVDIGDHVLAGQVLATIDTPEQQADLDSATAGLQAAEATLRQADAAYSRQKSLLEKGFTTQRAFDSAQETFVTAQGNVESAKANLATAQDQLSFTRLEAPAPGVITARSIEVGQVVTPAQTAFTLAQDGDRDAVFDVYESVLAQPPPSRDIDLALVSDPSVKATGTVREVSPSLDQANGTVRVKIAIRNPPRQMTLGAAVAGFAHLAPRDVIDLPWTALSRLGDQAAVWVVDPASRTVSQKPVAIDAYTTGRILVRDGLKPGEIVVAAGAQLLRPGQAVSEVAAGAAGETQ